MVGRNLDGEENGFNTSGSELRRYAPEDVEGDRRFYYQYHFRYRYKWKGKQKKTWTGSVRTNGVGLK